MEARSSNKKAEPEKREKGEIKQEATASPSEIPPLEEEDEPPPLEEVSEPHSKASTPPLSSPLSEGLDKGDSPSSYIERERSPSSLYAEEAESPSSYTENASSPAEKPRSPSPHIDDLRHRGVENNTIPTHYDPSSQHRDTNNTHTKAGIGSNTTAVPIEKIDAKPSMRPSIPSITHSVVAAAKHVSFKSRSLSSRSSSAIYGSSSWWKGSAKQMKIVEVALRFGGAVLALITFSVMAATSEKRQGAGSTFKMKFSDYQAYNYLVAVNVISFVYSCWQLVVLLGQLRIGGIFTTTRDNALFTYVCDQVLAFLLFSASTAAATAAQLSRHGLHNIWPPACSTWSLWLFCSKADAAVVLGFFSSFFVISSAVFSGYHVSHSLLE